ncbi:MAG: tetratricopeptide repeat protein [Bacteroidota bacterium]
MNKWPLLFVALCLQLSCSQSTQENEVETSVQQPIPQAISLMGDSLFAAAPSDNMIEKYNQRKATYEADTTNVDNLIWYGRFAAYKGDYHEAISIYSDGIRRFPEEARLYRHRGHRYISMRKFEEAIQDLEYASQLIQGTENEMEPDGLPNAQNIPVSSNHGNIWYHLGLAYYLSNDMENALRAYKNCLASTQNDDNVVSSTHWIYMILRRMGNVEEANTYLEPITTDLNVIENMAYHKACLFYKGAITLERLTNDIEQGSGGDAMKYALGNWPTYLQNPPWLYLFLRYTHTNFPKKGGLMSLLSWITKYGRKSFLNIPGSSPKRFGSMNSTLMR